MRRAIFLVLICFLVILGAQRCENLRDLAGGRRNPGQFTPASGPTLDLKQVQVLAALDGEYTRLVESVMPSVVAVTTSRRVRIPQAVDPFDYFFGRRGRSVERTQSGLGSGVIISKEGHILTNHHVIAGMDEIRVQLNDGRIEPARLVGTNEDVDIAVLQIKASNITPLPLGDSDAIHVGQLVFAVGNPFGLQETVTQGIISAKGRAISDTGPELLQTDAAVNPGNSGGPLLNLRGEVIGINSAIYSQTGNWAGISFAVPSNTARRTMEEIVQNRTAVRSYLGVVMMDITPTLAQQFGLSDTRGTLVADVMGGSPAEKAGIQDGDVIKKFGGHAIADSRELRRKLMDTPVGTKIEVVVLREGKELTLTAEMAEMPENFSAARVPRAPVPGQPGPSVPPQSRNSPPRQNQDTTQPRSSSRNVLAGIRVGEIPPQVRANLPETVKGGVLIQELDPSAPAAQRLQVGDVIEQVNQQPVASVAEYAKAAAALPPGAERALLFVCRGQTRSFVVVTP